MKFQVFGKKGDKWEVLGGKKFVTTYSTDKEAIAAAKALVGYYDALEVRDENGAVVWDNDNAMSAPRVGV